MNREKQGEHKNARGMGCSGLISLRNDLITRHTGVAAAQSQGPSNIRIGPDQATVNWP